MSKLRVHSHIVGATCFVTSLTQAQQLREFYGRMFSVNQGLSAFDGTKFVRELEPSIMERLDVADGKRGFFSTPTNHRALWVPHIACDTRKSLLKDQSLHKHLETILTLGELRDPRGNILVATLPEATGGERIPAVLVDVAPDMPVFQRANSAAPFPQQPRVEAVVNWADILVVKPENQRTVARLFHDVFGWNMAVPMKIPGNGEYITLLNDTGDVANRHKLCGLLPKAVLLPKVAAEGKGPGALFVPFLCCANKDELLVKAGMAVKHGGEILLPPMSADGDVSVIRDPFGGIVGLYHRTDDWDGIKPSTKLVHPDHIESVEGITH